MLVAIDLPALKPHQHLHICMCGDFYVCSQDRDKCPVPEPFVCVACELDQQDAYLNALEANRADHRKGQ